MNIFKKVFSWLKGLVSKFKGLPEPVKDAAILVGELVLDKATTKFAQVQHIQRLLLCLAAKEKCYETDLERLSALESEISQRIAVLKEAGVEVEPTKEALEELLKKYE